MTSGLVMPTDETDIEGYITGSDPQWNQSYYYNFFDPVTQVGGFIRLGILEHQREINTWLIIFRGRLPLYTRTNISLAYSSDRPLQGIEAAGMRLHAIVPLKETLLTFADANFSAHLRWEELHPMVDCIAMSHESLGAFAGNMINVHWEGTSRVKGYITVRGERIEVNATGFRDISAGPRNWSSIRRYATAWPIFENGMSFAGARGVAMDGRSAYLKVFHNGQQWVRVGELLDATQFSAALPFYVEGARWTFTDENGVQREFTCKPIFRWLIAMDSFVISEQMMSYTLDDGVQGYGLYETGYRLPWQELQSDAQSE